VDLGIGEGAPELTIASHGPSASIAMVLALLEDQSKTSSPSSSARRSRRTPQPGTVTLTTVHAAKGREFDSVYVVGLAEDVVPSFQSRQKGATSPEMEEERRNCFVAITRAKEQLVLSYAGRYRGWAKIPSRFLAEVGLIAPRQ
jgi:superfamily I DNA/RNA helicase